MNHKSTTLLFFSPTATTRTVLEKIAQGMGKPVAEVIDITRPDIRNRPVPDLTDQVLLIGAPVYAGRLPKVAADYFKNLKSSGTPAIPLVLYGNREFEDALLELKDILDRAGFSSVAAGAFIGEHSFSTEDFKIATDRPDNRDLERAYAFGQKISTLMETAEKADDLASFDVPGNFPYRERKKMGPVEFIEVSDECDECSTCVAVCPVNAIDKTKGYATLDPICIHCCACIKACPRGARIMKEGPFKDITRWLFDNYTARKEPQVFFPGSAGPRE
ncbi:EFR1 family ferrodoxin [Desulfospira joergensenii]|uniref:EFR1 family ferrodoxin n=1 Tax=Desulfospira joergensenii TaxID=53329 RepID=UPI0003B67A92|nr:EFR1 family ferrodoxin [Desulfospira joergensenii]